MHCFSKSLIVIRRYHHFTHRAANHCCQSLNAQSKADMIKVYCITHQMEFEYCCLLLMLAVCPRRQVLLRGFYVGQAGSTICIVKGD